MCLLNLGFFSQIVRTFPPIQVFSFICQFYPFSPINIFMKMEKALSFLFDVCLHIPSCAFIIWSFSTLCVFLKLGDLHTVRLFHPVFLFDTVEYTFSSDSNCTTKNWPLQNTLFLASLKACENFPPKNSVLTYYLKNFSHILLGDERSIWSHCVHSYVRST